MDAITHDHVTRQGLPDVTLGQYTEHQVAGYMTHLRGATARLHGRDGECEDGPGGGGPRGAQHCAIPGF